MALEANVPNTRIFSIRNKLLLITGLFIFSFVMTELFETYVDTIVDTSLASMELRENQTASLKLLETTIVEFTLAGMDAIIDKGDGKIAEKIKKDMTETSTICRKVIPTLPDLANTPEKSRLAKDIVALYPSYENAILTDLPKLITERGNDSAFAEIDDRIDALSEKIDEPLMAIIALVAAQLNIIARQFKV